jgi:hypothetical protein
MKINFPKAPRILLCVFIFLFAIIISGCFMADNKFYLDNDIITNSHVVGKFRSANSITNIQSSTPSLTFETGANKHYIGTYREGENWIKLDIVLFQLDTNIFLDIHRLDDSGESHNPGQNEPNFNLLRGLLIGCQHCVFRIAIKDNQIEFRVPVNDFLSMTKKTSEMNTSPILNFPKLLKFTGSTEELRNFLIKHISDQGSNEDQNRLWIRSDK